MKSPYVPPELTIVAVSVEHGFVMSDPVSSAIFLSLFDNSRDDNNMASTYSTEDWKW